jgi:hypothetical protein
LTFLVEWNAAANHSGLRQGESTALWHCSCKRPEIAGKIGEFRQKRCVAGLHQPQSRKKIPKKQKIAFSGKSNPSAAEFI